MDKASFGGVILALGGILLGSTLEGGKVGQIMQPTAAMIVFGGTIGAVMINFPLAGRASRLRQGGNGLLRQEQGSSSANRRNRGLRAESPQGRHRFSR